MTTLTLKLECDNAAFDDNRAVEISRILRETANRIDDRASTVNSRGLRVGGRLVDVNGNTCGSWELK